MRVAQNRARLLSFSKNGVILGYIYNESSLLVEGAGMAEKSVLVNFKMSPEEKAQLDKLCETLKITRSEYLRFVAVTPSTATDTVNKFIESYAEVGAQMADRLPRSTPMGKKK